jgi:drug/metabolite transporter (DMT)-like permease
VQPWWSYPFEELGRSTSLQGAFDDVSMPVWALALWTVVLGTIVPFALSIAALRHLPATRLGIMLTFEPVAAALVAWAWLEESLTSGQLTGAAIVVSGIFLAQTAR